VQRHLLAIFAATIVALVAQPLPMGASVVVAMTLLALTGTLPPAKVLSGFINIAVWLIFLAFLFGRAFAVTGLGNRIGYLFVRRFARSPLSLGYSLAAADLVLAPFVPSDTARGGSVIFPVARSVAVQFIELTAELAELIELHNGLFRGIKRIARHIRFAKR
jgi:divalent anion:Na+ symporter, DASS family